MMGDLRKTARRSRYVTSNMSGELVQALVPVPQRTLSWQHHAAAKR
jgi:hypothetical protein